MSPFERDDLSRVGRCLPHGPATRSAGVSRVDNVAVMLKMRNRLSQSFDDGVRACGPEFEPQVRADQISDACVPLRAPPEAASAIDKRG